MFIESPKNRQADKAIVSSLVVGVIGKLLVKPQASILAMQDMNFLAILDGAQRFDLCSPDIQHRQLAQSSKRFQRRDRRVGDVKVPQFL